MGRGMIRRWMIVGTGCLWGEGEGRGDGVCIFVVIVLFEHGIALHRVLGLGWA
jgi:hypothetical protein